MFKVAVGHSEDPESAYAINDVLEKCREELKGLSPQAGIIFAATGYNYEVILNHISEAFPGVELIGCTTDGEISSVLGFTEDSLALVLFCSDEIEIKAGVGRVVALNPGEAARQAVNTAKAKFTRPVDAKLAVLLTDPMPIGASSIFAGLKDVLGKNFPIVGGVAGDQGRQLQTYQFYKGEVLKDSVVMLLFSGPLLYSCGAKCNFVPVGAKKKVTKAHKNVVYTIDNKPAMEYYRTYVGDKITLMWEYILAVEVEEGHYQNRAANDYDKKTGSITFNGDIPENATVQICVLERKMMIQGCAESIIQAITDYPGQEPSMALAFSCLMRKMLLGTHALEEAIKLKQHLSLLPFCGFYTYGEFGSLMRNGESYFNSATFVTLLLGVK